MIMPFTTIREAHKRESEMIFIAASQRTSIGCFFYNTEALLAKDRNNEPGKSRRS